MKVLKHDIFEPSITPWASSVVLVPNTDGSYRYYVYFRPLNLITVRDSYPLLRMFECIDSLGDSAYLSTLDCNWGYWQIHLKKSDKYNTKFV